MNNELEQKRLLFAVERAKCGLEVEPKNLVVKARRNSSRKCQEGRDVFYYGRTNATLEIDNEMKEAHKPINSQLLRSSVKRVSVRKAKENTLSA